MNMRDFCFVLFCSKQVQRQGTDFTLSKLDGDAKVGGRVIPGKEKCRPLYTRAEGSGSQSRWVRNISSPMTFETPTAQPVARSCREKV
jgi:hypothetical protein